MGFARLVGSGCVVAGGSCGGWVRAGGLVWVGGVGVWVGPWVGVVFGCGWVRCGGLLVGFQGLPTGSQRPLSGSQRAL